MLYSYSFVLFFLFVAITTTTAAVVFAQTITITNPQAGAIFHQDSSETVSWTTSLPSCDEGDIELVDSFGTTQQTKFVAIEDESDSLIVDSSVPIGSYNLVVECTSPPVSDSVPIKVKGQSDPSAYLAFIPVAIVLFIFIFLMPILICRQQRIRAARRAAMVAALAARRSTATTTTTTTIIASPNAGGFPMVYPGGMMPSGAPGGQVMYIVTQAPGSTGGGFMTAPQYMVQSPPGSTSGGFMAAPPYMPPPVYEATETKPGSAYPPPSAPGYT